MSRSQRTKGRRYEQKIATFYRELGFKAKRGWQSREGSDDPDVIVESADALQTPDPNIWVECTHQKQGGIIARKFRKAVEDAKESKKLPILHAHFDNDLHLVVMDLETWGAIMARSMRQ